MHIASASVSERAPAAGAHRLSPLLTPRSIALVGASPRPGTPGNDMIGLLAAGGFDGEVFPVNPAYDEIGGRRCWPSIGALPGPVDLAVLAVANARVEAALAEAIAAGAGAAVIFGSCLLPDDTDPPLIARLAGMARAAGIPLCGGNGMGFYNDTAGVWVGAFPTARQRRPGGITFISHSGSPYGALAHNDARFRFNLIVSPGQELSATAADYLDYALDQPETRVVGLFLETVRDPPGFLAALDKAARRQVPVVVLKVGRTARGAALALSHTGAMAGNHAAYRAVFERFGVLEVETIDELACTLLLFAQPRRAAPGALAVVQDSGGERELVTDLAEDLGVRFAEMSPDTVRRMAALLDPGLEPVNPLDAWGTGRDFVDVFAGCFTAMLEDPGTALGVLFNDLRDDYYVHAGLSEAARRALAATEKPVVYATNYTQVRHPNVSVVLTEAGIPVLDGTVPALKAVRHMLAERDFRQRAADPPPAVAPARDWRARLAAGGPLSEAEALALLADYGVPVVKHAVATTVDEALRAAADIGYPVALKTAMPGMLHKTEQGGVILGLSGPEALRAAYAELGARIGPRVLVADMLPPGVELAYGMTRDAQFGPLVMVAAGGVLVEKLGDARHTLAPFGPTTAVRLLDGLRLRPLLDGHRGRPAAELARVAEELARFSVLCADLSDLLEAIDVNPLIAGPGGAIAVDALVLPRASGHAPRPGGRAIGCDRESK